MKSIGLLASMLIYVESVKDIVILSSGSRKRTDNYIGESDKERILRLQNFENLQREKRGLKRFYYKEDFVWARDKKNADRKAKLKGYI